jgi:hypothetical protein
MKYINTPIHMLPFDFNIYKNVTRFQTYILHIMCYQKREREREGEERKKGGEEGEEKEKEKKMKKMRKEEEEKKNTWDSAC